MGYKESDIKNVASISGVVYLDGVVYEKDEAAMLEVDQLKSFMLELDEENSLFLSTLDNLKNIERVSFETLEKLVATHLLQQQYAIRSHVYEYS